MADNAINPGLLVTFVDCEATSFSGYCSEVGIAQVWKGRPKADPSATIEPHPDFDNIFILSESRLIRVDAWLDDYLKWDSEAEKITGITRDLLIKQGQSAHDVASWMNSELTGLTPYSDACYFDKRWIDQVFKVSGIKRSFNILQMEHITRRWDVDTTAFYKQCRQQFEKLHGDGKPHRAAADAISWAYIFLSCWREENANKFSFQKLFSFKF